MSLTRARTQSGGWWVSTHRRRLTTSEMLKLQGMRPDLVGMNRLAPNILKPAIGNAMSANVIEMIVCRLLYTCGLCPKMEDPLG